MPEISIIIFYYSSLTPGVYLGSDIYFIYSDILYLSPDVRGVSRIFIIGFPTSGLRRYFNRGGEATS